MAVTITLSAQDDASSALAKVREAMGGLGQAAEETGKKTDETRSAFDRIKQGMEEGFGLGLGYAGFRDLRDIMDSTIETVVGFNAQLETMGVRLENLTGSVGGAADALQSVKDLSEASPFEFKDIEAGEERLLRFNFSADQAGKLLQVAADAAAGGAGSVDTITQAFGRLNEKTDLSTRGLMGLMQAGIPVFDILAKGLNVTTAEAENLVTKGLIPTQQGIQILADGIEQRFPHMAATVAEGFDGTVKNLKETIQFATAEMGKPLFDVLESAIKDALAFLKSPDVKGALEDFSTNVASTVRDVIDWFKQLGSAMSQPEVQANLHAAWQNIKDIGSELWGLVRDFFIPTQSELNKSLGGDGVNSASAFAAQIKILSGEIRDFTGGVKEVIGFLDTVDGALNSTKDAGDQLALTLHNELIQTLQDALTPLQLLLDTLNELALITEKVFHIQIDIPGQAGLQAFLDSIHGVQTVSGTGQPAPTSTGGPAGIPNASAMNTGLPAAGDIPGWVGWLQRSGAIPTDLADNPVFISTILTGAKAESGLNPASVQPRYTDPNTGRPAGGAMGFFQFDPGGMGGSPATIAAAQAAGMSVKDFLTSPEGTLFEAQQIVPQYAQGFRNAPAGLSGAALAANVADYAERPAGAWPGGAGDNNYRANYVSPDYVTGGASGGVPYGPAPVAGQGGFIGPAPVVASSADLASKVAEPLADTFATLISGSSLSLGKIQTTEDRSLTSAADQFGIGGTADQAADADAKKKLAALDANKAIQDNIAQRKAAVAQEVQDDTDRENQRLAADAVVYNRGLQDEATAHSRKLEDDQILVNQQVANVELVHQRDLQDAQTVHQQQLALAATKHQQDLQDAQTLVQQQLANTELLHQRSLQDAQIGPTEQLQAQAVIHSRTLENAEVQYQYERSLSKAKTDAERAQITTAHQDNLENIAHQHQLQDAEIVYQQGLQATALAKQRADQDAEIKYQNDRKAAQLVQQRADAATESQYQMGLAATEIQYQRGLQDTEIKYQQGVTAEALARSRALADAETAYNRDLEDKAAAHTAELAATAREFAKAEKAKVDAVDKQLADEAFARQKQQVADELAAKKASIAEEYAAKVTAAIETARIARETLKTSFDQSAQDQIDAATKALAGFNGAGDPIIAKMKADWIDFDSLMATATTDDVGNQTKIQTAQAATAASATTATATIHTATTGASADYAQSATEISKSLGITDTAVETSADHTGKTWDVTRDELNTMVNAYGIGSKQVSDAFGITDTAIEQSSIRTGKSWDQTRLDMNTTAIRAGEVLGNNGLIPTAAGISTKAFDDVEKSASKTTALDQLKSAAQQLQKDGFDPASAGARTLQAEIDKLQSKTITITTVFNGSPIGSQQEANAAISGGSGISEGTNRNNPGTSGGFDISSQAGRQAARDQLGAGFVVTNEGIRNNATGALVQGFAQGGIVPGPDGAPILIMAHGGETVSPQGGGIDYDKLAEAVVRAINKNGSFVVGVDQIHTELVKKIRRTGPLGLK
jgi:tape measure protein